ncbi:MAG: LysR family transcriptional regulator [Fusobacteriaceae bacterium]|nr:LysR family transcriptional regulator [Fusobacteriaceae bacterium]MBN2837177.1 LysR family transcriptional regulator [Fusobacteriaceae bacterium]
METYYVFYIVAEYGNISKAAKKLFVSQPAVTKSIKNLEENLGIKLFNRNSKGVLLTEEGKVLYEYVKNAYIQIEKGEKIVKQLKNKSKGVVRIGISNTLCKYYFMPFLKGFHEKYPDIKIEITNRVTLETLELLEKGNLDCAIVSKVEGVSSNLKFEELLKIQDIFVSKEKPIKSVFPLEDLKKFPMLFLEKKNATRKYIDEYLLKNNVDLEIDIEISSMEFLVEFAKIGLGVASVIENFVIEELEKKELYKWEIEPAIEPRFIGLLYNEKTNLSIASQTFIDFMKNKKE